ncbi:uncharacterized protein [Sinocyclocheilus grahami]|uniref:uncharacterized protein isoform X1 n=1 Tax=Sinocyclocheilus grahami TaxID=75366 RepID=UPI0007ACBA8E|nr:PREDICTED: uncharacterized protein LOC107601593 isoform X1 [Sinocyclocheilus grahami]
MMVDLRQQGMEVGGFAQTFWTLAVGLELLISCRSESIAVPLEMSEPAPVDSESSVSQSRKRRSRRRAARSTPVLPEPAPVLESAPEPAPVYESDPSPMVLEDSIPVVLSPVVLEDLTLVVLSLVVLVVSEVATEQPNFTAAAIKKKAIFTFGLWAVLRGWEPSESTLEPTQVYKFIPESISSPELTQVHGFIPEPTQCHIVCFSGL